MLNKLFDQLPTVGPKWKSCIVKITGDIIGPDREKLTEEAEMWSHDIIEVIKELLGNATYGKDMVFAAQDQFNDVEKTERRYTEMWMADWWKKIQVCQSKNHCNLTHLSFRKCCLLGQQSSR